MRYLGGRFFVGLFLLLLGIVIILKQLGFAISVQEIFSYWPVLLILLGLDWASGSFRRTPAGKKSKTAFSSGQFLSGLLLILIGTFFLLRKFGYLTELSTEAFWNIFLALLLIVAGFNLISSRLRTESSRGRWAFLGGIEVGGSDLWRLESGSYFAFMGAIKIDLTAAEIPRGETVVELTAVMSGIDVLIPSGLAVVYDGSALLGGITFKDQEDGGIIARRKIEEPGEQPDPLLRLRARALMGGIKVKEGPQILPSA